MALQVTFNSFSKEPIPENTHDQHFVKIAFLISLFILAFFTPIEMCWGAAFGFLFQLYKAPLLKMGEPVVTIDNAIFALVGCGAALLRSTPAGAAGGLLFRAIPFFSASAIGCTAYRFAKIPLQT